MTPTTVAVELSRHWLNSMAALQPLLLSSAVANKPSPFQIVDDSNPHRYPLQITPATLRIVQTGDHLTSGDPSHSLPSPKPSLTVAMVHSLQLPTIWSIHRRQNPTSNRDGSHYLRRFCPHRCRYGLLASACNGSVSSPSPKPSINSWRFALSAMLPATLQSFQRRFNLFIGFFFFFFTSCLVYE